MARGAKQMKPIEELRDRLKSQIADLQKQLEGVEMSLRAARGEPEVRQSRANVKQVVLTLLEEAGAAGINANGAVDAAAKRNEKLERPTVSSLLSRLKAEGFVAYDGTVYRLKKYVTPPRSEAGDVMH